MKISDSAAGAGAPGSGVEFAGAGDEFAGVDELIADLTALLDAGLVVVHEPILGPARYGVAPMHGFRRRRREEVSIAAA
jgi:hypothetical protein